MSTMYNHFRNLSCMYRELRTTDLKPIKFICEKLQYRNKLKGADIGCGAGRYDLLLLKHLPDLHLICVDVNEAMVNETTCYLEAHGQKNFSAHCVDASDLQLPQGVLDFVSTFNAIHHFEPILFLNQAKEALKSGGYVFVYTRLKSQNRRNVWGRFFPGFSEKEDRLYTISQIEKWIEKVEPLALEAIHFFKFKRVHSLEELLSKAENKHYSTFSLYTEAEFDEALEIFKQKINHHFTGVEPIQWTDENVMILFVKD
ncbi:MAG: class I SAM-dependent methyltransferase [Desulfobacterales bacterium]